MLSGDILVVPFHLLGRSLSLGTKTSLFILLEIVRYLASADQLQATTRSIESRLPIDLHYLPSWVWRVPLTSLITVVIFP